MRFFIVDAFASAPFGGNGAGVVLLEEGRDFPPDDICVKVAAELRYSETAFLQRLGEREFRLRYFTPAAEVDLCGHATIGSFAALRRSGLIGSGRFLTRTAAGEICVEVGDDGVLMDMAAPVKLGEITDETELAELYRVMGLRFAELKNRGLALRPQLISTGLADIMLPVLSLGDLARIAPDFRALSALSERYGAVGVHAFTRDGGDATCHVRNFAPLYGIDEESATGTANGALTYYGYLNGFIAAGDPCTFLQGEAMGRPSVIHARLDKDGGAPRIRVGGAGVVVAEGNILI